MEKCVHVFFSGLVQGVGFRFTARSSANRYKIKGWVRNTNDGKVEIWAEGEKANIYDFLNELQQEFLRQITDTQAEDAEPSGEYKDFQIKFD